MVSQSAKDRAALAARARALRLQQELMADSEQREIRFEAIPLSDTPPLHEPVSSTTPVNPVLTDHQRGLVRSIMPSCQVVFDGERRPYALQPVPSNRNDEPSSVLRTQSAPRPQQQEVVLSTSGDEATQSSSPADQCSSSSPPLDPNWFEYFYKFFKDFQMSYGSSLWYRILSLILITALVIGVFILAGFMAYVALRGESPRDAKQFSPKSLCLIFNLTLPVCDDGGPGDLGAKAPVTKTDPNLEWFNVDENARHYAFDKFLLVYQPLNRTCSIFWGLNPSSRRFPVVPFSDYSALLSDGEQKFFSTLCDADKVYKAI